jgi:GT2 family glycosyltransferase
MINNTTGNISSPAETLISNDEYTKFEKEVNENYKEKSMTNNKAMVDIILPCWNNLEFTKLCIDSIVNNTRNITYHIIVVNNASTDGTGEYLLKLQKEIENLTIITNKENLGWVKALNQGIKAGDGDYVCFLNNDTLVTDMWLDKLISRFDNHIAAVGPISNAVSGRQHISHNRAGIIVEQTKFLIGFCLLIRRDVLDMLYKLDSYYLDERFGLGSSEEIDLAIRINKLAYSMLICRDVYIHHFYSKTLSLVTDDLMKYHKEKSEVLIQKWGQQEVDSIYGIVPKVLIAIPTLGNVPIKFLQMLLTIHIPYHVSFEPATRTMPDVARNRLIMYALEHDFDYVWFLDDDTVTDDRDILVKLINHNKDIVGCQVHMRLQPFAPCVFNRGKQYYENVDLDGKGLQEVDAMGAACLLVKTDVFRKLKQPWFKFEPLQILGVGEERWGEDIYFHRKAQEAGYKIFCDGDIKVWHVGERILVGHETYLKYNEDLQKRLNMITTIKLAEE